jgi:4-hydroxy-4-methyl-2-oxoglutarate aldolase
MNREEEIVQQREVPYPYSIDSDELVSRFEKCYCSALSDVLTRMGLDYQWLGPEITCKTKEMKRSVVAGLAFTVQWLSDPEPDERDRPASKMLANYFKNSVLCVDTGHDQRSGYLGELNTNAFRIKGVRASIIDGGARDSGFVKLMDYPVFCRFTSPVEAYTKNRLRGWQLPIFINGVRIEPMDVIVGDSDGVMVIPKAIAEQVLAAVEDRKAVEDETRRLILDGMSAEQAAIKMGYKDL